MYIQDLVLESHHRGTVLLVRTFGRSLNVSTMQILTACEDENGGAEQVSIYHYNFARWPDKRLPSNCVLAIKDPYYRSVINGRGLSLSVFHPSDIVFLDEGHPLFPQKWKKVGKIPKDALQWKLSGNMAFQNKNYNKANHCYTKALSSPNLDESLECDVRRNRALVKLHLGQYDEAKDDALACLLDASDAKSKELDSKALFRAARTMYELSRYSEALELFQRVIQLSPSHTDAQREIKRTAIRLREEQEGVFNFAAMSRNITGTSDFHAEQASFLRRTNVHQTADRGNGLFATEPIACGEVILCEKAFMAADMPPGLTEQNFVVNPSSKQLLFGSHVVAWVACVEKIFNTPSLAHRLLSLHDNQSPRDTEATKEANAGVSIIDDVPIIDVFRVMNILEINAFTFVAIQDQKLPYANIAQKNGPDNSVGIWTRLSSANHSCLPNTQHSFLGDFMIVRANKDIPKGAELTVSYAPADGKYEYLKMETMHWGFKCDCNLCVAEEAWGGTRSPLIPGADSFELAELPIGLEKRTVPAMDLINQVKHYVDRIEATYPEKYFSELPRIGLAKRHSWLTKAHKDDVSRLMYGQAVVRDHGFKVVSLSPDLRFDRENIIMTTEIVDAFAYMHIAYKSLGEKGLSQAMKKLALECYIIMNGTATGFKEYFNSIKFLASQ